MSDNTESASTVAETATSQCSNTAESVLAEKNAASKERAEAAQVEIRRLAGEVQSILAADPLDLLRLRQTVESICFLVSETVALTDAGSFDTQTIDQLCRKPIQRVRSRMKKDDSQAFELTRLLMLIASTFIRYGSRSKSKLFMNLADFYRTIHLNKGVWDEFGGEAAVKDCLMQQRALGEDILADPKLKARQFASPSRRSSFLSNLGEAYRALVEHGMCSLDERGPHLERARSLIVESLFRDGRIVPEYRIYAFSRLAWSSMRLAEAYMDRQSHLTAAALYQEAATYYLELVEPGGTPPFMVRLETAWESRCGVGDCMLALGRLAASERESFETIAYYKLAEPWYVSAHYLKHSTVTPLWETADRPLLGKMADFYYLSERYEEALPFYRAIMEDATSAPPQDKSLYDLYCYRWGECLAKLHRDPEALDRMETALAREPDSEYRIKHYLWMLTLCRRLKDYERLQRVQQRLLCDGAVRAGPGGFEYLDVILNPERMADYVDQIEGLLDRGEYHRVARDLSKLISQCRAIHGKDDKVLMTLIARADIGMGKYVDALRTLRYVQSLDPDDSVNSSIALCYIGRTYTARHFYGIAAQAFQESFEAGGDLGMLALAASALQRAEDYFGAIELYENIRSSGEDKKPGVAALGVARCYWALYLTSKDEALAQRALAEVSSILTSGVALSQAQRSVDDWSACQTLAGWADDAHAAGIAQQLLCSVAAPTAATLINALASHSRFQEPILSACIQMLTREFFPVYLLNATADYLMKATVHGFFSGSASTYQRRLQAVVGGIFDLPDLKRRDFLCEYYCASKGAYVEFLDDLATGKVRRILPPRNLEGSSLLAYLKDVTAPAILDFLRDTQSLMPPLLVSGEEFLPADDWFGEIAPILREDGGWSMKLNPILEESSFRVTLSGIVSRPPGWCAWQSARATIRWFFPDGADTSAVWQIILGRCAWSVVIEANPTPEAIELQFEASFDPSELTDTERSERFEMLREGLRRHPVPWFCGFSARFEVDHLNEGRLRAVLTVPTARSEESLEGPLLAFARYMAESFGGGMKGQFNPSGYRTQARRSFPRVLPDEMKFGHWVEWTRAYVGQHAAIAILESLASQHFQRVLHDVSRPFRSLVFAESPDPNMIRQCIERIGHLEYEIHALRRLQLSPVLRAESRHWVNLDLMLSELTEEEERYCPEVSWQLQSRSRIDLLFCEPSLLRRALSCLLHNATEACSAIREISHESPQVVLTQDSGFFHIAITNPYVENCKTDRQRTGYGLPDARAVVEGVLRGSLTGPEFDAKDGYCRVEVLIPREPATAVSSNGEREQ
jgi:tetratricopeptide (TPR) repeat protein